LPEEPEKVTPMRGKNYRRMEATGRNHNWLMKKQKKPGTRKERGASLYRTPGGGKKTNSKYQTGGGGAEKERGSIWG